MSKAIRVKKGSEILEIQDSDLQAAVKDGYLPTERVIVANSKTNESYEIDPQDLPNAFKDGFTYSDVKKKVGGLGAAVGGEAGISGLPSEEEKVRYPQLKEGQEIVEYPAFGGYTIGYKKPEKIGGQEQMQREKDPYAFNEKELTSKITKAENPENIKERHQVTSKDPITGVSYIDKLKKQKENLEQELFPTIKEAKSWVNKKGKDLDIKNNKTDAVAVSLIKNYDSTYSALRNMSDKGESISGISLKLMSDGKDLSPIEKAQIVFNTLNLPETKDLAENNDKFKKKYIQEKVHFYENYPDFGNKTLATQLAQKMEDKGMTGGFWSDPSLSTIDKAAELLIKDGTWGDTEKNYYKYNLRNKLSSFSGREAILPHADFVHKVGYGIYRGTSSILNGIRTALNKYVGGGILDPKGNSLFQNIGLLETEEDRAKRLKEESEKEPTVAPKRPLTKLGAGGEFLGQVLPVVGATSLGFSPTAAFALQSYGANEDEGLRRYGTANPLKVQSYALAGTVIDVAGMEFLPIKKISGQLKSFIGENAEKAIRKVATGGTTEIAAKKDLADIIVKKFGNVLKETGKTGGILTSYDFAHKVANAIFDGQHFDLKKELTDAAKDFPDKLLTGLPLSILGVIGKSEPKVEEVELQATPEAIPIRETAKRGEQVIREGIPTEMAKEAGKTITTPVEAKTIKPIEEPSKEQQLKDVQEGNVVTFNYENESQVPEVFRDKISSKGEIDGKPFVRVTVAKSLADYELGKKEGVEEVVSTPTEVKPEGKPTEAKLPSEKVVDVDKEIQKRQKIYAEPQGNQAEINKFVSDVNKYNNMPNGRLGKGTIQGLAERNRLMAEAERLGVSFKAHGKNKFILTDAKYIDKTSSNLAIDKNFKPLTERSEKAQSLLSEVDDLVSKYGLSPEMVLPNDIMGADGKRMNMGQIRNALKDIKNNIPSKGANLLLDAIEAMAEKGVVEIRDGQRLDSVPIDEYFQEMRNIGENSTKIEESAIKEAETMTDEALDIWLNEMSKEMEFESDEPYLSKEKQKEYDESITESPETEIGEQPEVQPTATGEEAKVGGEIGVEPVTEKLQAEAGGIEPPPPPKPPVGEMKTEREGEGKFGNKAILNTIFNSKNISQEVKDRFEKEGLKYKVATREEAAKLGKEFVDSYGIDDAVALAESGRLKGGVSSAIFAEALNQLHDMELKAKNAKDKFEIANKYADISIRFDEASREKGRDISFIDYFYKKSPLGIEIVENKKRKQSFDDWAKSKEGNWKEFFDELKKDPEVEKLFEQEVQNKLKEERAKSRQERIKKVDKFFDDAIDKIDKGGAMYSTIIPPKVISVALKGMKEAYHAGEAVAKIIDDAVDYISSQVGVSWNKDKFKQEWSEKLKEKPIKEVLNPEQKAKNLIDKFSQKLNGLNKKQKLEVTRRAFKKLAEQGTLDYDDFRKIISDVLGIGEMTLAEAKRLKGLVDNINNVEVAAQRVMTERTPESLKAFNEAELLAAKSQKEINDILYTKPDIMNRITSIMQLSTLGAVSLVANVTYNIANMAFTRFLPGVANSLFDRAAYAVSKVRGKDYKREWNTSLSSQKEYFEKLGLGTKEAISQFYTGLNRKDYIQKELYGQSIRPVRAWKELYASMTGKKKLSGKQIFDKSLEGTFGIFAEAIARALNVGDKPFRFASEGIQAGNFAKALNLKGIDYKIFMQFPKEEAYRRYKEMGLSEKEASERAEYIEKSIIREGERATFQQDNLLNDFINAGFNTAFGKLTGKTGGGLENFTKSVLISPYIKIPVNSWWSYMNLVNPELAFLQSLLYAGKSIKLKDSDPVGSRLAMRESRYWLSHGAMGIATRAVVLNLVSNGVYNPSTTGEETKKEREGEQAYEPQGTFNISKYWALMRGEDPSKVKGGILIQNKWLGAMGSVGDAIAHRYEELTPEQKKNQLNFWNTVLGGMEVEGLNELSKGVFSNSSAISGALNNPSAGRQYLIGVTNLLTNIVHPAMFAQTSKAQLPYVSTTKADTFIEEVENSMLQRSSFLRNLVKKYPPAKVGIWGNVIEKEGNTMSRLFGITKVNKDAFARPIYDDAKRTGDIGFFPPSIPPDIYNQKLDIDKHRKLEVMVGEARKDLVAPYINDSAYVEGFDKKYSELTDEQKKKVLNYLYLLGKQQGTRKFIEAFPEFEPKEKTDIEKEDDAIFEAFKKIKQNE